MQCVRVHLLLSFLGSALIVLTGIAPFKLEVVRGSRVSVLAVSSRIERWLLSCHASAHFGLFLAKPSIQLHRDELFNKICQCMDASSRATYDYRHHLVLMRYLVGFQCAFPLLESPHPTFVLNLSVFGGLAIMFLTLLFDCHDHTCPPYLPTIRFIHVQL